MIFKKKEKLSYYCRNKKRWFLTFYSNENTIVLSIRHILYFKKKTDVNLLLYFLYIGYNVQDDKIDHNYNIEDKIK